MYKQISKSCLHLLFFGGLFLLCFSCTEKDDYEVISSEDVLPQAEGQYDYVEDTTKQDHLELNEFEQRLIDTIPNIQFTNTNYFYIESTRLMPNQLGSQKKNETYFILDSIPYHFIEWTFKDSSRTVNAFYNWLDCFGNDCRSIKLDEEVNGCKQAFIIWVSDTRISYFESTLNIDENKWKQILLNKKGAWNFIIRQAPNGKIKWIESPSKDD